MYVTVLLTYECLEFPKAEYDACNCILSLFYPIQLTDPTTERSLSCAVVKLKAGYLNTMNHFTLSALFSRIKIQN